MSLFGLSQAAAWLEIENPSNGEVLIESVEVDSRKVQKGCLFVALPGERVDGHQYLPQAFASGAVAALVSRIPKNAKGLGPLLLVPDTLKGLQQLARQYRSGFSELQVLALTGSNGKTTTKEIAASILSRGGDLLYTQGNFNSDIGLPLTVFGIREHHRWALLEMGMNRPGEIAELVSIVQPDVALITNVGSAHVGLLGSLESLAKEKKDIFSGFQGHQRGIVWEDDPFKEYLIESINGSVTLYGEKSCEDFIASENLGLQGHLLHFNQGDVSFPLWGQYNLLNCLAAVALTKAVGIPFQVIKEGIEAVKPAFGRSEVLQGNITLVRDCYNANPDSMIPSLKALDELEFSGRKILVLADMGELGEAALEGHIEVLALVKSMDVQAVYLLGPFMSQAIDAADHRTQCFEEYDSLESALLREVRSGDLVWLKGSRAMALERLSQPLLNL
ncbi:MAG: UDP-N-acetylmuramoyl-tripeptide--D-alanyl-D-alanine ligase [Spirochaetaceae bacterium]|jgi:UDP-N-acetylmuramoyl-tripeptide--D-alanyl-D-alanine ligase|nr:UDP-N-acetylmuramoyl-tripeptide--D-alanyl-D-alanine ligase [Spirochaetaceae bacterium]